MLRQAHTLLRAACRLRKSLMLTTTLLLLILTLCFTTAVAVRMPPTVNRDISSNQIVGDYTNVQLDTAVGHCPDAIVIGQVEPLQAFNGVLYVIPHSFIQLPLRGGSVTQCVSTPIENPDVSTMSSTVLRRSSQLNLDESFDIISKFRLAQEEFFLGYELGSRTCGRLVLPAGTISMWVAPEQVITAQAGNVSLTFTPPYKYIYYFPESRPCLFRGNANQVGAVVAVPTPSPSPTPPASSSITPFPDITSPGVATPPPSAAPAASAAPSLIPPTPTNERVCFPASARVELEDGANVRMDALRVGERVLVDVEHNGERVAAKLFSEVFAFTHSDATVVHTFTQIMTESNLTVELTSGHYIYANGKAVPARSVKVGQWIKDAAVGRGVRVSSIRSVSRRGLYNPQTYHGNVVVNGVVATTYSSAFNNMETAHALLAPVRFLQRFVVPTGFVEEVRCRLGIGTKRGMGEGGLVFL